VQVTGIARRFVSFAKETGHVFLEKEQIEKAAVVSLFGVLFPLTSEIPE
jgi:hypothetical protein